MPYSSTLGGTTTRNILKEGSYVITQGFPGVGTLYANQEVKLLSDGTVAAIAASTDKVLGRVVSAWQGNDYGNVRVATPFEAIVFAQASGTVTTAQELACTSFDVVGRRPVYKTAASGDCVSAIALSTGATTTEVTVGILHQPYMKP